MLREGHGSLDHAGVDNPGSPSFPRLAIDLAKVFDFPLEPGEGIQMVRESRPPYVARVANRRRRPTRK